VYKRQSQWIEDIGLIWLDFWLTKYNVERVLTIEREGQAVQIPFDGSQYNQTTFSLKIDVGASTQWSEIASIQTLDNLLEKQHITFRQYLERIYNGLIPQKQELIDEIEQMEAGMQFQALEDFVSQLSPELQAAIQAESQMMVGGGQGGMPMQAAPNGSQQ
jgi:hypothetical protein